jgi:tyrosine-protein kinase Etk/Wzc
MNLKSNAAPPSASPMEWDERELHLRDYMQVLWRRLWVIILTFVIVIATTLAVTLLSRPAYRATALLEVQKNGGGALSLQNMLNEDLQMSPGLDREVSTEAEILRSRTVAENAVRLSSHQLSFDRSERLYKKLFRALVTRIKGTVSSQSKEEKASHLTGLPEPLDMEVLGFSQVQQPLGFQLVFDAGSSFRVLDDEDDKLVARGRIGEPVTTPFFSICLHGSPPAPGTDFPMTLQPSSEAVKDLQARLKVSPVRNTDLIRLELTSFDRDDAQKLLTSVISAYQKIKIQEKTQMASKALDFIDQQLSTVDADMQKAVDELKRYKEGKGVVSLDESTKAAVDQLADLQKSRNERMVLREQARSLLTALRSEGPVGKDSFYALGVGDPTHQQVLITLAQNLSGLQAERAGLRTQYKEVYPAVQALDRKISELKGKIEAEVQSVLVSLDVQGREEAKQIEDAEKRLEKLPEAEKQLADLTRRAKVYEDTYSFMLQKKGELQVTRAGQIGDVWIAEEPYAPARFIKPRPLLNTMLAVIMGLVLGIGLAFFFEYLDDSVKNADDVQAVVDLPVLGTIGRYAVNQNGFPASRRFLPALRDSKSQAAESFRTFRSNLLFSAVDRPHRSILFTSPLPEEGKTTCAANLGICLSQLGKRVLLVDADLRKSVMHRTFNSRRSPGLADVLVEQEWQNALDQAIQNTEVPNLDLLASGRTPPNPNEMLGSEKMGRLMDFLGGRYDFVLFDTAPLLAVSDAVVMARRVDGVLLVVRGGRTSRGSLQNGVDVLSQTGARILGVVLNDVDFKRERYYYYYHYEHYYAYSDQTSEAPGKLGRLRKLLPGKLGGKSDGRPNDNKHGSYPET